MNAKHTPEWNSAEEVIRQALTFHASKTVGSEKAVAVELAESAQVLAAAPDLLAALERINEWCCYASEENTSARLMALQQIGISARDAIYKATGGQS